MSYFPKYSDFVKDCLETLIYNTLHDTPSFDCPACGTLGVEDDQYCCTYCWNEGGQGSFKSEALIKENFDEFVKLLKKELNI